MRFTHTFRVNAPQSAVADFHSRSASMPAITPPPMIVRVHAAPPQLTTGDVMDFTLWAGPIPVRWVARIEDASVEGFTDRQVAGPFAAWEHRHRFVRVDDRTTDVVDEVEAQLKRHPFWGLVGALMWAGMPVLFAFRRRRTKRLLEAGS
ncbi:MAG: SRPBCC family protein [Anaerolineae bacterium]